MSLRTDSDGSTGRRLVGVAVIVLALGAVLLTVLAFTHVRSQPSDEKVAPVPTFTQPSRVSPSPTPTAPPSASAPVYDRSQERFLAAGSGVLWRGVAGSCGAEPAMLERSTDDGGTWTDVTPNYLGIEQLERVSAFAGDQAQIVASMGEECQVQALRTFTQGRFWESYDDVLAASQYIDPTQPGSVVRPGGALDAPCADGRAVQVSGSLVALSCAGTAYVLEADDSWVSLPASGVAALTTVENDLLVAHVAEGCSGLALTRYVGAESGTAEDAGCIEGVDAAAPTAIASVDDHVLVWSGETWEAITQ